MIKLYGDGSWDNWTGAFDYARIGKAADFVSVMAYDDSKSFGPVASLVWVKQVVAYSLERIPAEKISLGIPFYFWSMRDATGKRNHIGTYPAIAKLLKAKAYTKKGWSEEHGVSFVSYVKGGKRLTAWYEDKRSFEKKLDVISTNNLRGFSAWALGQEDPKIWEVMLAMRAPRDGLAVRTN
jgi:spore germination protein YaaH